jgi:hypothetical protein
MSWLLGAAATVSPGAAAFVVFDIGLIAAALMAFVGVGGRSPVWSPLAALALTPLPQLIVYPAIVWKDVLFAGSLCAGFACIAHAVVRWRRTAWRIGLLTLAAVFLALASLARQNGVLVLPFAVLAVAWGGAIAARSGERGLRVRFSLSAGSGVVVAAAALLIAEGVSTALAPHLEYAGGEASIGEWRGLQTWDLVNALSLAPATELPALHAQAPWLEKRLRTEGVAAYSPAKADTLEPLLESVVGRPRVTTLIADQWRDLIVHDPRLYLRVRARSFGWVLLTPDPSACVAVFTGVSGPDEEMGLAGLTPRRTALDDDVAGYALGFAGTPLFSHAMFLALGVALAILLLRRRRPADIAVAAMLGSGVTYAASYALISVACDYRYLYPLDLAVLAALLYGVAAWNDPAPNGGVVPRRKRQ